MKCRIFIKTLLIGLMGISARTTLAGNSMGSYPIDSLISLSALLAQSTVTASSADVTLGVCEDVQTPDNPNGQLGGGISPASILRSFWFRKYHEKLTVEDAKVSILEGPKNGAVHDRSQPASSALGPYFEYLPNRGFFGTDRVTFLVEVGGKSVKVVTTLMVVANVGVDHAPCFKGIKQIDNKVSYSILNVRFQEFALSEKGTEQSKTA